MTSQNYSQVKEFQVPNDTYLILPANNGDSILYFTMSAIAIVDSENIISSPQISSYFMMDYNYLVYQTIEGNMYGLNTETFNCDSLGMIPLISKFTLLNRTTLFCVSEYSDSYIISIPEIIGDKINFKFEDLPRETLTFTPRTIRALFKDRKLIVAAGHASQSSITNITNSLQFHKETIANVDQSLLYSFQENNYNGSISSYSQMKLFCYHGDTIILSNPKETVIISGSANISSNPTFVIGRLGQNSINKKNSYIQIHTRGIKNIATVPTHQGMGYGKALISFIADHYKLKYDVLQVGTGDVPSTVGFYKACGFEYSHRLKNFFTDNYDHPIYEDGVQLVDMIYLKMKL